MSADGNRQTPEPGLDSSPAATLTGIIPASFVLAHFGAEMVSADTDRIAISVLALGAITLIPIAIKVFRDSRRKGAKNNA